MRLKKYKLLSQYELDHTIAVGMNTIYAIDDVKKYKPGITHKLLSLLGEHNTQVCFLHITSTAVNKLIIENRFTGCQIL